MNATVSSKLFDKQDDFNFEILYFPFLYGDAPRSPSYGNLSFELREYVLMLVTSTRETKW